MGEKIKSNLSICIFGENCAAKLKGCIKGATEIVDKILFVDLGSDDDSRSLARELSIPVVDPGSLSSALETDWVLLTRPDERPLVKSLEKLSALFQNQQMGAYGVPVKVLFKPDSLAEFQWVRSLDQYKNIQHSIYASAVELRLTRRSYADLCLGILTQPSDHAAPDISSMAQDIVSLDLIFEQVEPPSKDDDHDQRCLKGDITYGIEGHDYLWELSSEYIQFGVLSKSYLDSFFKGAELGFGGDRMYLTMLGYLTRYGYFNRAKAFYERWMKFRVGKEEANLLFLGGFIYANLLMIDKSILFHEKALDMQAGTADEFSNLGKLHLVKGNRDKSLFYLNKSYEMRPDPVVSRVCDIVSKENWRHLKLSLCMITKDEEKNIRRSLRSLEGIVDEIIIVDTGSSDETVRIAKEHGAKVFTTIWHDDFSDARNLALREATGDYILCMDADEFIDPRHRFPLAFFKAILPPDRNLAFGIIVEDEEKEEELSVMLRIPVWKKKHFQVRLFPNGHDIRFHGSAFEDVNDSLKELGMDVANDDLFKISHDNSEARRRMERKRQAVLQSFQEIKNPDYHFDGALFFLGLGDLDQTYIWLEKSNLVNPVAAAKIALLYAKKLQPERAMAIADRGLKIWPDSHELKIMLAGLYFSKIQFKEIEQLLKSCVESTGEEIEAELLYYYGISLIENNNTKDAVEYIASAIERDSLNTRFKMAGIYAFSKVEHWEDVIRLSGQILSEKGKSLEIGIDDFADVVHVLYELYKVFLAEGENEEAHLCGKVIEAVMHKKIDSKETLEKMSHIMEKEENISHA